MKKNCALFILLLIVTSFNACKKVNDNHTETPAYVAPSQPGIIVLSQTSYTLYADTGSGSHNYQVTLSAKLYNSNGQLDPVQPTFSFESNNTEVATVDNTGSIKGLKVGTSAIAVTDNVHGVTNAIVSVLPYDSVLFLSALSIVFSAPVIELPVGTSQNATYQLFDGTGNVVSTPVILSADNATGITISGNSIQASASGIYTITAFNASQQQLSGALIVHAYVPHTGSGGWHWDPSVDGKKIITRIGMNVIPKRFLRPGLTAKAMIVNVYEEDYTIPPSPTHLFPQLHIYEASPDAINFGNDVLTLSNGRVKSNKGGETAIYATYKGVKSYLLPVWVHPDFRGKYAITVDNSNPGDYPTTLNMGYYYNDDLGRSRDIGYYCDYCGGGAPDQYTGILLDFTGCNPVNGSENLGGYIRIQEMGVITGDLNESSGITWDGVWLGNLYMSGGQSFGIRQTSSTNYALSLAGTGTIIRQDNIECKASNLFSFDGTNYTMSGSTCGASLPSGGTSNSSTGTTPQGPVVAVLGNPVPNSVGLNDSYYSSQNQCTSCTFIQIYFNGNTYISVSGSCQKASNGVNAYYFNGSAVNLTDLDDFDNGMTVQHHQFSGSIICP